MRSILLVLLITAATAVSARSGFAQEPGLGTVAGYIEVKNTKVKTSGPKSFKHVAVFLEPRSAGVYSPPETHAVMDQRGLDFIPHVLVVQRNTTVDFLNSDNDRHNVYFLYDDTGKTLDIGTWGPGQAVSHTFKETGLIITLCQLHLEMAAYILVLDAPFFTLAEIDDGSQRAHYEIKGVPAGDYQLKVWHKKLKMKGGPLLLNLTAGEFEHHDIALSR